ncbi:MAG: VCBS repeat-containing protein [Saprospiraceae bacterium]|nr:VCBS repeat-containing protein [Saprospiraceae bacterium]
MSLKGLYPISANVKSVILLTICSFFFFACNEENQTIKVVAPKVQNEPIDLEGFEIISAEYTGIDFDNKLDVDKMTSFVYYINVFNGGGVALGDINNDGLIDIYLTGNLVENKLYLNKGNLQFEDITKSAGVACKTNWSTGATFADVNNDGLLDLYVCHSYDDDSALRRANSLFINQGDNTFSERAKEYGIADIGYSIHASFLDYDKDGHLDMFLGNTPRYVTGDFYFNDRNIHAYNYQNPTNKLWSDKLYKNNGDGTFSDVTVSAGILNYGYMLGVSVGDYNKDGWDDIFVAVDHGNPDYLYINNGDGTFSNEANSAFKHISLSSMGSDAADLNNDSKIDLVTLDMLSFDNYSEKTQMASMNPRSFYMSVDAGLHYQYMRNMLQLNQGNAKFSEIGQMAGIHKSDWSWSVLAADFSNDGHKELYVTNGYYRAVMDKDTRDKFKEDIKKSPQHKYKELAKKLVQSVKPQKNKNVLFKNNGDYTFTNVAEKAGCDENGFSSGAAYADLDNDGDLDLVVNNIDQKASILKNNQRENDKGNYIQLELIYKNNIPNAGTKIEISSCNHNQYFETTYSRGYQSSYTGPTHIGIGRCNLVESVKITWPDGKVQLIKNLTANQLLKINYEPTNQKSIVKIVNFVEETTDSKISPIYYHIENEFDDFEHQVLLPHKMSEFGPHISTGDINNDGFEDFYVGGSSGQAGVLYIYEKKNKSYFKQNSDFEKHKNHEDLGSVFFDLENDGDLDLYVVSGGNEFEENSPSYQDRVYVNDGNGLFTYSAEASPEMTTSGGCVEASDYDNDGFVDLFVGTRHKPHRYPFSAPSYIYKNVNGKLTLEQNIFSDDPENMGMVTDACFADLNNDKLDDLIVVGEWMPVSIFINQNGKFINKTSDYNLSNTNGWWNCIEKADLDNDGDFDFVLGNLGLNYKYKATQEKPFHIYAGDFDENGKSDIVLGQYYLDVLAPVRGRQCSSEQMPLIAEKFPTYTDFGKANLETVYGEYLDDAYHLQVSDFRSSILLNNNGSFELTALPQEAQFSPINSIVLKDLNDDGLIDIIAGGNLYASEVETGRADSGVGIMLFQDQDGEFNSIASKKSGLFIDKDVKSLTLINSNGLLVGNNNDALQYLSLK